MLINLLGPRHYQDKNAVSSRLLASILFVTLAACSFGALDMIGQDVDRIEAEAIEFFNKAQDAHEKGELLTALDLYEKALQRLPEFPEAELQRGKALESLGRFEESESAFRRAVELRDDWSLAYSSLGAILVRRGKFEQAGPMLRKAMELDPENTPALVAYAELTIKNKAPESELRSVYKQILVKSTGPKPAAVVLAVRALLERSLGEGRAAVFSAQRALESDPRNISMLALLADAAVLAGDLNAASDLVRRIGSIEPSASEIPLLTARIQLKEGKVKEALQTIDGAKTSSSELLDLKEQIEAVVETDVRVIEAKLASEPRNIVALSRLCTLLRTSEPLRAIEFCQRASDVEPTNAEHLVGLAGAMVKAKQYARSVVVLRKLLSLNPENQTVRANLATALFQQKLYNDAKVQFLWLAEKQPANAATYFFLAVVHDELGEYPDAMANYQLFLKFADTSTNQLEIDKVNLRLPTLQKQLDAGKGKNNGKRRGGT